MIETRDGKRGAERAPEGGPSMPEAVKSLVYTARRFALRGEMRGREAA